MPAQITRRTLMAASASALAIGATQGAFAQAKPKMRFSAAFPETDLRAEGYKAFAEAMKNDLDFEPYWNNTLFKQGTELVALQREKSRTLQSRARRHLQADPGLVADDLRVPLP